MVFSEGMEREAAANQIKNACNAMSIELMKIHPAVPGIGDKPAQDEIYKALYELTKGIELIKKRVMRLGTQDTQRDL